MTLFLTLSVTFTAVVREDQIPDQDLSGHFYQRAARPQNKYFGL